MNKNSCIIIIDERRVGGMLNAAHNLGGEVTGVVIGSSALAEHVAGLSFHKVLHIEIADGIPAEAYANKVADTIAGLNPGLLLASDVAAARILLGATAAKLGTAITGAVRAVTLKGENIVVTRSTAEGKVVEDIIADAAIACIFDGEDVDSPAANPVTVEKLSADITGDNFKLLETLESGDSSGLLTATRVVGIGSGLGAKADLQLIEDLAAAMNAEVACTLPLCDDLRWFPSHCVLGSTHVQVAPDLYIAVAISGQPQHMAGVRDSKVIVAINNDPDARIFKNCNYALLGDLYKVVPALTEAFKNNI